MHLHGVQGSPVFMVGVARFKESSYHGSQLLYLSFSILFRYLSVTGNGAENIYKLRLEPPTQHKREREGKRERRSQEKMRED